ncbi:MAG: alpha/beta fold hydrolase [Nannocystaceae bacterium]
MPTISVNGCEIYYEDTGGEGREVIVFSHGLLWSTDLFAPQVEALRQRYRVLCYDHRGQGRSAVPPGRSITIEACYRDAVGFIEALGLGPCHFAGLSMGGFVGLRVGARRPDLLRSLILIETSADPEENVVPYRRLNFVVRWFGVEPVADRVMHIMFGPTFMRDPARAGERAAWRRRLTGNQRSIYKAVNGVIERGGVAHELREVPVPTLILVGDEDTPTPPVKAARIHAAIAGSRLVTIARAGHSSSIEAPEQVNAAIFEFLGELAHSAAS